MSKVFTKAEERAAHCGVRHLEIDVEMHTYSRAEVADEDFPILKQGLIGNRTGWDHYNERETSREDQLQELW